MEHRKALQERAADLLKLTTALLGPQAVSAAAPFYCRPEDRGFRIESAMFGPSGQEPANVLETVQGLFERKERILPCFHQLLKGADPLKYADKYLTVTVSITRSEIEGKGILIDSGSGSVTTL